MLAEGQFTLATPPLNFPKDTDYDHLVIKEAIRGERLAEGAPPVTYIVTQDGLEEYRKDWRKMRAVVFDTTVRPTFLER